MSRYEDGKGSIVDESSHEAMDFEIDEEQHALDNVTSRTQYLSSKPEERVEPSASTEVS